MQAFISWQDWGKLTAETVEALEFYWANPRQDALGIHFEIAQYRITGNSRPSRKEK